MDGPGGQLWRIQTPGGLVTEVYLTNSSSARSLGYEFITPHVHVIHWTLSASYSFNLE